MGGLRLLNHIGAGRQVSKIGDAVCAGYLGHINQVSLAQIVAPEMNGGSGKRLPGIGVLLDDLDVACNTTVDEGDGSFAVTLDKVGIFLHLRIT